MPAFAIIMLVLLFNCSDCNDNQDLRISTYNKIQIACAQLRASNCSHSTRWDLRCSTVGLIEGLTVTAKPTAMRPDYRSFMAGKVKFNIKRHTTRLPWDAALRVCQSEGGSLVKIDTEEKEAVIEENIKIKRPFGSPDYLWLGLRYFTETSRFLWTDKTPLVHSKWGPGEPSHSYKPLIGVVIKEECCALSGHLFLGTYWNDRPCSRKSGFICEVQ